MLPNDGLQDMVKGTQNIIDSFSQMKQKSKHPSGQKAMKEYTNEDQYSRKKNYMASGNTPKNMYGEGYSDEFDSIGSSRNKPAASSQQMRRETGPKNEAKRRQGDIMDRRNMQLDDEDNSSEPAGNAFLQEPRMGRGTQD